jgi:hypothetical protein
MTDSGASTNWDTLQQDPAFIQQLANYLVEEGLLTQSQVDLAYFDQDHSGKFFADVLLLRGWLTPAILNTAASQVAATYQADTQPKSAQSSSAEAANPPGGKRQFFEQETVVVNRADFDLDS